MIRFIKKWWLIRNLTKAISEHTDYKSLLEVEMGEEVVLFPHFFIVGDKKYPGLVSKSLHRFSRILWWRKKDNSKKRKKRTREYYNIYKVCVKEGYIEIIQTPKGLAPSTATPLADKIDGWFGLLQGLLKEYSSVWSVIIALFVGIYGSAYLRQLIKGLWNLIF